MRKTFALFVSRGPLAIIDNDLIRTATLPSPGNACIQRFGQARFRLSASLGTSKGHNQLYLDAMLILK